MPSRECAAGSVIPVVVVLAAIPAEIPAEQPAVASATALANANPAHRTIILLADCFVSIIPIPSALVDLLARFADFGFACCTTAR